MIPGRNVCCWRRFLFHSHQVRWRLQQFLHFNGFNLQQLLCYIVVLERLLQNRRGSNMFSFSMEPARSFPFSTLYPISSKIEDAIMTKLCWVEVIRKCDCSSSTAKRKGFSVFAARFKVNVV